MARRNFGEADRILVLYAKDHGKISLIAKGVRKPKSRKRGHIEVFNKIKFQAVKTGSIDLVTEVETIDQFEDIRSNLKKISMAYYLSEVIGRVTHDGEKNLELYEILDNYLNRLSSSSSLSKLRMEFLEEILIVLGFWPKGMKMDNPDQVLEEVVERKINSARVGKKVLQ